MSDEKKMERNSIGNEFCAVRRNGIWWNDESFSTKERMLDYARKLEKAGHIVFNYL